MQHLQFLRDLHNTCRRTSSTLLNACFATIVISLSYNDCIHAQLVCGVSDSNEDMLSLVAPEDMEGNDGPFYIKLYPVIVRKSDGSEGTDEATVNTIIENMKLDFEPHNIFFYVACIQYHDDSDAYFYPQAGGSNYDEPEDGITLLLYDAILSGSFVGYAYNVPSIKLFSYVESSILSHEVGHCLGLYHTHQGTTCSSHGSLNEYVDGTDCDIRGDYVCDTDAAPNFLIAGYSPSTCTYENTSCVDPNNEEYVDADPKNIMSYGQACRQYFTDGQGERMRNYLANAEVEFPGYEDIQRNQSYVASNQTWSDSYASDVDILIKAGVQLNIESTVNLSPGIKILIEPGAHLLCDGATLTVGDADPQCPSSEPFWSGVFLTSASVGYPALATIINGSTVEHAKTAFTWTGVTPSTVNGRVKANSSSFLNNYQTFHFYSNWHLKQYILPSMIYKSTIEVNDSYLGDNFDSHIYLVNYSPGLMLLDCNVNNSWSSTDGPNRGVSIYQSRFWSGDNIVNSYPSIFKGFDIGVVARKGVIPFGTMYFNKVVFESNLKGVIANTYDFTTLQECEFKYGSDLSRIGVEMNNSSGYTISRNKFNATSAHSSNLGVFINGGGSESTLIDQNSFQRMGTAFSVTGTNASMLGGLQFRCNKNTQNAFFDFQINSNATISEFQGMQTDPTGNEFSHINPVNPAGADFKNLNTSGVINYWYDANETKEEPINVQNLTEFPTTIASSCPTNIIIQGLVSTAIIAKVDSLWLAFDSLKTELDGATIAATIRRLKSELHQTKVLIHGYTANGIQLVLQDTSAAEVDLSALRTLLALRNSFEADLSIAGTYLADKDTVEFDAFVDDIPTNRSLTSDEEEDLALYSRLTNVMINAWGDDRSEAMFVQSEVDSLELIALANERIVAQMAKNILEVFYGYQFDDLVDERGTKIYYDSKDVLQRPLANVYPNPSTDFIQFEATKPITKVQIVDYNGFIIGKIDVSLELQATWNTSGIASGMYLYKIYFEDGTTEAGKLFIVND